MTPSAALAVAAVPSVTGSAAVAACCVLAAVVLVVPVRRRRGADALDRLRRPQTPRPRDVTRLGAVLAGLAVAVVVDTLWGVPAGVATAVLLDRLLRRLEPAARRAERRRAAEDLPIAADLMAAALRAGSPVDNAAAAVGDALSGPLGERLHRVARALRLGDTPAQGWEHLGDLPGADRFVAAAVRSSTSGGALAGALTRLADDLRADRGVATEAATRRAGVLIVLPLGLCFLPAFVLAGLAPVVVAILGDVLRPSS